MVVAGGRVVSILDLAFVGFFLGGAFSFFLGSVDVAVVVVVSVAVDAEASARFFSLVEDRVTRPILQFF